MATAEAPRAATLRTERLEPGAPLPAWWGEVFEATPDATVYLSSAWMQTWLEIYGREFEGEWMRWEDAGRPVGGCLLVHARVRKGLLPMRAAFLNATGELGERVPLVEFNDVMALPGYRDTIVADLRATLGERPWDCLMLNGYAQDSPLDLATRELPGSYIRRDPRAAPYVDIAALGGASYESTLSGNTGSQIRRSRKLYEQRSGPITFRRAASADEALAFLEALATLHNQRWAAKGVEGSFASASRAEFHRRLIPRLWVRDAVDLIHVRAGDADIGYLYNFALRGKAYSFQSGFVYEQDPKLKPGLVSHRMAVEEYQRRGFREYDFLAGDSRYKRALAKNERTLHWTTVYRDTPWMRALVLAWKVRNRILRRAPP